MKNKRSATLLEAIIRMGMELGTNVVVEGIETKDQVDLLLSKGIIGQCYYYSRPIPVWQETAKLYSDGGNIYWQRILQKINAAEKKHVSAYDKALNRLGNYTD